MKKVERVELKMQKTLRVGDALDENVYSCEYLRFDSRKECLYLLVNSSELTAFSLDAIYFCELQSGKEILQCTGRIKERSNQKAGKILKLEIENGFYKINIKSVDKQMP